jgi:hypothetical protein
VRSTEAWRSYRVSGAPFFVVVDGVRNVVATEGVAWGMKQTIGHAMAAKAGNARPEVGRLEMGEVEH